MNIEQIKQTIDVIIDRTFERLQYVYYNHQENKHSVPETKEHTTRIVFPKYSEAQGGTTRVSEQELRFAFVEEFNEYCNKEQLPLMYSVETPTEHKHKFKGKKSTSAQFDLVVHDEQLNRVCLIEFKANNSKKSEFEKDFFKLKEDRKENILTYFIELLKSYDSGTISKLKEKIESKDANTIFRCYALEMPKKYKEHDISDKF